MRIVFGVVVYKTALEYSDDFIKTINNQTYENFDILIINDDLNEHELNGILVKIHRNVIVKQKVKEGYLYETRIQLLETAKRMYYDLLIWGDFDDSFSNDRVERTMQTYSSEYSFYYNDLLDFPGEKVFTEIPECVEQLDLLIEQNFLGMSNTAINLNKISISFIRSLQDGVIEIFDWYLYTRLVLDGHIGKKAKNCFTRYRIHSSNIVGIPQKTDQQYKREIAVKIEHYKLLTEKNEIYWILLDKYSRLLKDVQNVDWEQLDKQNKGYWWSIIQLL